MRVDLLVNGTPHTVEVPPLRRLLDILRDDLDLIGTKEGCGEGECGACAVLLDGQLVNACLVPALQLPGCEVVTIEGLGTAAAPDPVQRAFMDEGAAQCGFCIPGMVMASRALLDQVPQPTRDDLHQGLAGNLCRCTGYERIFRAVERAALVPDCPAVPRVGSGAHDAPPTAPRFATAAQTAASAETLSLAPTTIDEALAARSEHGAELVVVAGGTDLMVELRMGRQAPAALMDVTRIDALREIRDDGASILIGAGATFAEIAAAAAVVRELPAVAAMARQIGAAAIQNRATLAGNLVTASPAADAAPILMALDARLHLVSCEGRRVVPLASFYTGYRRTVLAENELLVTIEVPRPAAGTLQRFDKVGTRRAQAISKVSLGAAARVDGDRRLEHLRLAAGSVAATPLRLDTVAERLVGTSLDTDGGESLVERVMEATAAAVTPIDDVRSTADYRRETLGRLVVRFLAELHEVTARRHTG